MGRVFNPLGPVTPVTIMPKILFQKMGGDFESDDDVEVHMRTNCNTTWIAFLLSYLDVPRYSTKNSFQQVDLYAIRR